MKDLLKLSSDVTIDSILDELSVAERIYSDAILEANSLSKPYVTTHIELATKIRIPFGDVTGFDQPYSCKPEEDGALNLDAAVLEVKRRSIKMPICKDDFDNTVWRELIAGRNGMNNYEIPAPIQQFIIERVTKKTAAETERRVWTANSGIVGTETSVDLPTGWVKLAFDSLPAGQIVTGSNAITNPTTVVAELRKMIAVLPEALLENVQEVTVIVSQKIALAYRQYLNNNGDNVRQDDDLNIDGYKMDVAHGLSKAPNTALIVTNDYLHFGMNIASDMFDLGVYDRWPTHQDNQFIVAGQYALGTQVVTNDAVLYNGDGMEEAE